MISVQITCPFRYKYNGKQQKDIFFMSGEYYHLDPVKDKDEVIKLLSPSFQFKEYIHVNAESIPEDILKDSKLNESGSFHSHVNPEEIEYVSTLIEGTKSTQEIQAPDLNFEESPTKDAEDNYFASQIESSKFTKSEVKETKVNEVEEEVENEEVSTPDLESEKPEEEAAPANESFNDEEIAKRLKELDEMHYTKIQDVAEQYNIEYTKKDETIEKIIKAEFEVHDDIKELKGQYKEDEPLEN